MAPTECWRGQHHATCSASPPGRVEVALLTGREGPRATRWSPGCDGHDPLSSARTRCHADVAFRDLALAVIDEQHRFEQRWRCER